MSNTSDDCWTELEELGRRTGHVVCVCPRCAERQMIAYRPASQKWPRCRVCLPSPAPYLEPAGPVPADINKRPGQPRTKTQLRKDGFITRPEARREQ